MADLIEADDVATDIGAAYSAMADANRAMQEAVVAIQQNRKAVLN